MFFFDFPFFRDLKNNLNKHLFDNENLYNLYNNILFIEQSSFLK